jgi:hypothetical protein
MIIVFASTKTLLSNQNYYFIIILIFITITSIKHTHKQTNKYSIINNLKKHLISIK